MSPAATTQLCVQQHSSRGSPCPILPLQAAASPDGPLIWAIKENQLGLLRTLLDAGADPDGPGSEGRTP